MDLNQDGTPKVRKHVQKMRWEALLFEKPEPNYYIKLYF